MSDLFMLMTESYIMTLVHDNGLKSDEQEGEEYKSM
jgi:hypothetical protein